MKKTLFNHKDLTHRNTDKRFGQKKKIKQTESIPCGATFDI